MRILALTLCLGLMTASASFGATYKVVTNASHTEDSISKNDLVNIFMKKTKRWESGAQIEVVDLQPEDPVRSDFSEEILGFQVERIKAYWQKLIFSGRATPPETLASSDAVIAFVATNANAIGYVAEDAPLVEGVKVLTIVE